MCGCAGKWCAPLQHPTRIADLQLATYPAIVHFTTLVALMFLHSGFPDSDKRNFDVKQRSVWCQHAEPLRLLGHAAGSVADRHAARLGASRDGAEYTHDCSGITGHSVTNRHGGPRICDAGIDTGSGRDGGRSGTCRARTCRGDTGRGDTGRADACRSDACRSDACRSDACRADACGG